MKYIVKNCPLYNKDIDDDICFDISLVAERFSPEVEVPEEVRKIPNYKEICLNCPNHRDD